MLSSEELTEWQLYEQIEPFGERAEYVRWAALCALLVNLQRTKKDTPAKVEDFLPETLKAPKPPADPREAMYALAQSLGAKVVKADGEPR